MYVAGYKFFVLNNAFTSHWGFQSMRTRPKWRAKQQEENNAKFDEFAREVTARYGRDPCKMLKKLKKMNMKNKDLQQDHQCRVLAYANPVQEEANLILKR